MNSVPLLGVVITAVEPPDQLAWCLHHLRECYPNCPATIIEDGADSRDYDILCNQYRAKLVRGQCLKRAKFGGAWWLRVLEQGYATGADYIMKIDPDSKFQRAVRFWPSTDIAGTILCRGTKYEHVQGGAQLFSRGVTRRILDSGVLSLSSLADPWTYAWNEGLARHSVTTEYLCSDAMLKYIKEQLGLSWTSWTEVRCDSATLPRDYKSAAVSHPHKGQRL